MRRASASDDAASRTSSDGCSGYRWRWSGRGGPHIAIWIVVPIIVIITGVVIFQLITRLRPGNKRRDQ
jgi:hypothetical protein